MKPLSTCPPPAKGHEMNYQQAYPEMNGCMDFNLLAPAIPMFHVKRVTS